MKKLLTLLFLSTLLLSCGGKGDCYHDGKRLIRGEKGGCYYNSDNGNKVYVDRSYCNCG